VVGLGTKEVTVEAGSVIVVSEPEISVVIVEAGRVTVVVCSSMEAKQFCQAK
jgi:hypothetical protein